MSTIRTSIILADNISSTLLNITNAMNSTLNIFEEVQAAGATGFDFNGLDTTRERINAATQSVRQFEEQLQSIPTNVPVQIDPVWNIQSKVEIFQNTGVERFNSEMNSLNDLTQMVLKSQRQIGEQALNMDILPPNASWDINATQERIEALNQKLAALQAVDIDLLDDAAVERMNSEFEIMRSSMNSIVNIQDQMNTALESGDISQLNAGYNQLNGIAEQVERRVRETTAEMQKLSNIQWVTPQKIEIFENTGVERFQSEISSATDLMAQLSNSQNTLTQQAQNTKIFPPNAISDITNVNARIDSIRQTIQRVEANPLNSIGTAEINNEVEQLRGQLNRALIAQEQLNAAVDNMDVSAANDAYNQLNSIIDGTDAYIRDNINEQGNFNRSLQEGQDQANGLSGQIKGLVSAYMGIAGVKKAFGWVQDTLDLTNTQINAEQQLANVMRNVGATETEFEALKQTAASIRGYTLYGDEAMIGGAAELATYIKDADALNSMMGTLSNYAAGMSGGGEVGYQQMVDYATQLGKALDGTFDGLKKKGFELTDVQKAIINSSSLEELVDQGVTLSAEYQQLIQDNYDLGKAMVLDEVISQSWAGLAEQMAQTPEGMLISMNNAFGDIREQIGAKLYPAIMSLFETIQARMPQIEQAMYLFAGGIEFVISLIQGGIELVTWVSDLIINNWSLLAPIIYTVVAALAIYVAILTVYNTVQAISNGLKALAALQEKIHAAATMMSTGATFAQTAAQYGLNAALLACPLTWIIIAIVAIIGAIYLVIGIINKLAGTSISATGVIFGAFTWLSSLIADIFLGTFELVIGGPEFFGNAFIQVANFIGNVFQNPVSSVIYLFQGMADTVLALLQKVASALDFVFGSKMADTVAGWRSGLKDMADAAVAEYAPNENYQNVMDELNLSVDSVG
jgi:hypothetical protein